MTKAIHINALIPKWKRKRCEKHRTTLIEWGWHLNEFYCPRCEYALNTFNLRDQMPGRIPDFDSVLRLHRARLVLGDDGTE